MSTDKASILDVEAYRVVYGRELEALRVRVMGGDKQAVFTAMELFFRGVRMGIASECPGWLANAALIPLNEFAEGHHEHMEQAFGIKLKPMSTPRRMIRVRGREVFEAVESLRKPRFKNRKNQTMKELFALAGKVLNMGPGTVQDHYYDYTDRLKNKSYDRSAQLREDFQRRS